MTKRKWSMKYKKSINCRNPRGFSQKQYCKYGRNKTKTQKKRKKTSSLNPDHLFSVNV